MILRSGVKKPVALDNIAIQKNFVFCRCGFIRAYSANVQTPVGQNNWYEFLFSAENDPNY